MSELRKDPIINRWVIIASERAKRPLTFPASREKKSGGFCPLCPGNEEKTPAPIYTDWIENSSGESKRWRLRVVMNKFPALERDGVLTHQTGGFYEMMAGVGAHEVVVETPRHHESIADFDDEQAESLIHAYRERILVLRRDPRFQYVLIFKNHGFEAGASLEHPHSQIIALPIVPKRVHEEMMGAEDYYAEYRKCVYCEMIQHEINEGRRIVLENSDFIALAPFAARFPYETWILPKRHETHFEDLDGERQVKLAVILRDVLNRMKNVLNDPPYNFMLHTSPCHESDAPLHYHWHLEITPKLTRVAGFEWGTGFFINPMPPEIAAELLRGEHPDSLPDEPVVIRDER